jgi:hypothetical protein
MDFSTSTVFSMYSFNGKNAFKLSTVNPSNFELKKNSKKFYSASTVVSMLSLTMKMDSNCRQ